MARLAPRGLCLSKSQRQIPFGTRRSSLALVARRALHEFVAAVMIAKGILEHKEQQGRDGVGGWQAD